MYPVKLSIKCKEKTKTFQTKNNNCKNKTKGIQQQQIYSANKYENKLQKKLFGQNESDTGQKHIPTYLRKERKHTIEAINEISLF